MSGELIGREFRSYVITSLLGLGGMAEVYLARQTSMDRMVAIKVISTAFSRDPDFRARFDQEAHTIGALEHPHILPVIDYGEEDFGAFLVMRYVEGGTLEDRLQSGPLPLDETHDMLGKLAAALDYAHSKGVVHRDLKPSNILLDEENNPYLTDFGIAKILQSAKKLTQTGMTVGTPAYMAPEQWRAEDIGPSTDLYALGIILYEMVTGDQPFKADTTFGYMHKHVYDQPDPPRQFIHTLPEAAEAVILRAIAKLSESRFPSGRAQSDAFGRAIQSSAPTRPAPPSLDQLLDATSVAATFIATEPHAAPGKAALEAMDATQIVDTGARPASRSRQNLRIIAAFLVIGIVVTGALLLGSGALGGGATTTDEPATELAIVASATSLPQDTETPVPTASETPRPPTNTSTSTSTPTCTHTPTQMPTWTPTFTPIVIIDATVIVLLPTWTPVMPTPTSTWTPSPTSTPGIVSCAGLLPSQLVPGDEGMVNDQDERPLNVRASAGLSGAQIGQMQIRDQFDVLEGPTCRDGYAWFRVRQQSGGLTGWIAESGEGDYYVVPLVNGQPIRAECPDIMPTRLSVGAQARVDTPTDLPLRFRSGPGSSADLLGLVAEGTRITILRGMVCADGYSWWQYETSDGLVGWSSEANNDSYFISPLP